MKLISSLLLSLALLTPSITTLANPPKIITFWEGPSTYAMQKLTNDLINYNEHMSSDPRCVSIAFPNLAHSLFISHQHDETMPDILNQLTSPQSYQCPTYIKYLGGQYSEDTTSLLQLKKMSFYALVLINYTYPGPLVVGSPIYKPHLGNISGIATKHEGYKLPTNNFNTSYVITQ